MKTMLLAFAATVVIAVVAYYGLHAVGFASDSATASATVRL